MGHEFVMKGKTAEAGGGNGNANGGRCKALVVTSTTTGTEQQAGGDVAGVMEDRETKKEDVCTCEDVRVTRQTDPRKPWEMNGVTPEADAANVTSRYCVCT